MKILYAYNRRHVHRRYLFIDTLHHDLSVGYLFFRIFKSLDLY